jgi:hypothetical protein
MVVAEVILNKKYERVSIHGSGRGYPENIYAMSEHSW